MVATTLTFSPATKSNDIIFSF
ncbi:hypothetical protein M6B38_149725 [Iris pallida]|uniref:Uncharacterized protein n=1 Tax=Iris pallida TaxID=29817 RepID=A0AAX6F8W9_IRIPA|nr:hypothetical protein M6B38_149725 [Iris pallida]